MIASGIRAFVHACTNVLFASGEKLTIGENNMKCPRCGSEASDTNKEWDYSAFHVKRFDCEKCGKAFMAYYREGKLSHTIPKRK